jgi:hypothetical protein
MTVHKEISNFQFRGRRSYLHSTTVFDFITSRSNKPHHDIDFQFNKLTDKQCSFKKVSTADCEVVATFQSNETTICIVETDTPMEGSYPCNEDSICELANFTSDRSEFVYPLSNSASYLEAVIATYKTLLSRTETGKRGKLLFGRVKLKFIPTDGKCVVEHRRMIGDKFFEANLIQNDTKIGSLYFGQQ